jgi:hypothetical protein
MNTQTRILASVLLGVMAGTMSCQPQRAPREAGELRGAERMAAVAKFETYIFSTQPAWTGPVEIIESSDLASLGQRMFTLAARAEDGRHVVLVQSATYNRMLGKKVKQGGTLVYASPNGFKLWGGGPQKWYSEILLQGARSIIKGKPSEERIGYVLESPAGTFPALAVNGPVTATELHILVDSLAPARMYVNSQARDPDVK